MKKDKHRAWFTFHKGSFVGWLETHCPVQLLRHLLSHKYGSVINSFIFRAVQIVQSWNRKLGHTFYGLKTHNPLAKFDLSHQTSQGVTSGHFSKHLPCPWKWIHGFVSSAWRGQWFCRGHVPNSNIVTGLCSHLQVHPTVWCSRRKMWICLQFVAFCSTQGRALRALALFGAQHPEHSEEHTELTPTQHSTSWRARLGKALFGKLLFWILHSTKVILQSRVFFFSGSETIMIFLNSIFP